MHWQNNLNQTFIRDLHIVAGFFIPGWQETGVEFSYEKIRLSKNYALLLQPVVKNGSLIY